MSDGPTLGRWTDAGSDAPEELRDLLEHGRAALGSRAEVERLQASLARALGPAAGLPCPSDERATLPESGVVRPPAAGASRWLSRWLIGGGVAGGLLAGVAAWNALHPPPLELAPSVSAVSTPGIPPERERRAEPAPEARAPAAPPVVEAPAPQAPAVSARRPSKPGARAEAEAALLERARSALDGAPARALGLTKEHQRRFPRGALIQEREVIAIEALKRLGQERAAGAKASEFDERFRGSVHQERVRESATSAPALPAPDNSAR